MKGRKVSNSEVGETTGDRSEHWKHVGDPMRKMKKENVGLAGRNSKEASSCESKLPRTVSPADVITMRMPSNAAHARRPRSRPLCSDWLRVRRTSQTQDNAVAFMWGHSDRCRLLADVSGVHGVCVLAPVRLASASLLAVSQRFTPLFYLPGCARDFHWQTSDSNQPYHQSTAQRQSNSSGVFLPSTSSSV